MGFFDWIRDEDELHKLAIQHEMQRALNELELQLAFATGALEEKRRWNDLVMSWMQHSEIDYGRASDRVRDLEIKIEQVKRGLRKT